MNYVDWTGLLFIILCSNDPRFKMDVHSRTMFPTTLIILTSGLVTNSQDMH